MLCPIRLTHTKDQILQACCLRRGPVNAIDSQIICNISGIKDKILDLTIKGVSRIEAECSSVAIFAAINKRKGCEVRRGFDNWQIVRVADNLGVVVIYDGCRDAIGP